MKARLLLMVFLLTQTSLQQLWGAAALGVTIKLMNRLRHPWLSTGLYVAMGWVAVVFTFGLVSALVLGLLGLPQLAGLIGLPAGLML